MKKYINEMKKCIKLAKIAQGNTSPNPLVGCVILNSKGKILSTGCHIRYGEYHAERSALSKLDDAKDCTLVVNLEPCCHHGKTPPCTDLIIEKGIKRVVYGMKDPNPLVSGKGLQKLQDAGIEIVGPVLEKECIELNEAFVKNHTEHKPFIAIKTATTIDGKIACKNGSSKWITSSKARNQVKYIRNKYDAILTSSSTVIADNPAMLHKKKIILDRELKTDLNFEIYNQGEIYVFHDEKFSHPDTENIKFIGVPVNKEKLDIESVLNKLYEIGIMSILVEAGGKLNGSFLPFVDKIYQFIAPKISGDNQGISCFAGRRINNISECEDFVLQHSEIYSPDILLIFSKK
ncbi:bifunctional diaminohydroxyphosphoribosylaminopyrimidine deaminase/5-amino-6-(5-phosphoribosylamino)uracil reductase RibD [bacterium]|nr:bifunctional diaminohydroxyphosphoribosylaminopyrimidine deaminase/5-amino-6-(5-phosphoribosylamino)uracil reductase RibD [bacterium]